MDRSATCPGRGVRGARGVQLADGTHPSRTRSRSPTPTPSGARPFARTEYIEKFRRLAHGTIPKPSRTVSSAWLSACPSLAPDRSASSA